MVDWRTDYLKKVISIEDFAHEIRDGDTFYLTGNSAVPGALVNGLIAALPYRKDLRLIQPLTIGNADYLHAEFSGNIRVNTLFISANIRKAIQEGRADFTPVLLSELPLLFKNNILKVDKCLLNLSPPDDEGYCTYGSETGLVKTAAESARMRIAQINPSMPTTKGDTLIHISQLDRIVEANEPLQDVIIPEENRGIADQIAIHVAGIIPDGATIQLGIGSIPGAVAEQLKGHKNLGVHSELISDGMMDLVLSGAINGQEKTIHPGKMVAGFLFGSSQLYQWANKNDFIELHRTEYVNSPFTIAQNRRMVAVNSAIEIDLTGQVCADSIGSRFFSGAGGQADFIYGASLAEEGKPIITLPSTYLDHRGQSASRIVPVLKPGAGVITTRNHVHWVATEYGILDLYGKTIRERTNILISISHPDMRDHLRYEAKKLGYI